MIRFTDPSLFLKGTALAMLTDKTNGNIVYQSTKFQTSNITASLTMGEIRAGLGNPIAGMIPTDGGLAVNFSAADFSMFAKAAQAGAQLSYGAPVMVCQSVTASGTTLSINNEQGTPVANLGMDKPYAYVQKIGAASPLASGGTAYGIDPTTGTIEGFNAVSGTEYIVWYYVSKAGAQLATISTNIDPKVLHFSAEMAVFSNSGESANGGTRVGSLYVIVPNLKLGGEGAGVTGDQTTPDTTSISGQAIAYDSTVVSGECNSCGSNSSVLAYYLYVPCDTSAQVSGLAIIGGVITIPVSTTHTITEFKLVMGDNSLVNVDNALATYTLTSPPTGTTVNGGVITAGDTAGDCDITASVTIDGKTVTASGTLSVVSNS